ncbi:MAG: Trk system potassium transporter TrkA [Mariprofundaceae bacterium]|nr:Trk system potassium transporter TrkA [Mariprofundaceae bacterium]
MNILVLGAGEVGFHIASRLASEGHDVAVVDNCPERTQRVADTMDVRTVTGNAAHPSVLQQAGAENADLLIAATASDETNMLACQVAHSLFKVTTKMARIREPDFANNAGLFGRDELPIDLIISPEHEAAKAIVKRYQVASAMDAQGFAGDRVQLLGMMIRPKGLLAGLALAELAEVMGENRVYVVAHEHNRRWKVPTPDTVLLAGDSVYLAVASTQVEAVVEALGDGKQEQRKKRNVMLVGGGNVGFAVAQALEKMGVSIKLIEFNRERATWIADHLDSTVVLHGDALDRDLLEEEAIGSMDDFLALTNDDETNILSSLIARKYKVPHVVTLVNRAIYSDLVREIGLDVIVSPRFTTAASILRHVRKGRILGMSPLGDGKLEVIEAEALETAVILDVPLKDLKLPEDTVIGAIVRGEEVIIPDGETMVMPHDHVLLVTRTDTIREVERLFEVRLEFF